jgi:hypothetical protein
MAIDKRSECEYFSFFPNILFYECSLASYMVWPGKTRNKREEREVVVVPPL